MILYIFDPCRFSPVGPFPPPLPLLFSASVARSPLFDSLFCCLVAVELGGEGWWVRWADQRGKEGVGEEKWAGIRLGQRHCRHALSVCLPPPPPLASAVSLSPRLSVLSSAMIPPPCPLGMGEVIIYEGDGDMGVGDGG
jgi:hypothetical protein